MSFLFIEWKNEGFCVNIYLNSRIFLLHGVSLQRDVSNGRGLDCSHVCIIHWFLFYNRNRWTQNIFSVVGNPKLGILTMSLRSLTRLIWYCNGWNCSDFCTKQIYISFFVNFVSGFFFHCISIRNTKPLIKWCHFELNWKRIRSQYLYLHDLLL